MSISNTAPEATVNKTRAGSLKAGEQVREVVVDPALAELASGSPVAVACRDCGARFEGRAYQVTPCPRCGEVDVVEAGRVA